MEKDPDERANLIADPTQRRRVAQLQRELARLMQASGLNPKWDAKPVDQGIGKTLPNQKIR
jgi:N-acetylglucosamine-6-sulfatase